MVFSCYYVELINSKFESWQKNNILNGKWKKKIKMKILKTQINKIKFLKFNVSKHNGPKEKLSL